MSGRSTTCVTHDIVLEDSLLNKKSDWIKNYKSNYIYGEHAQETNDARENLELVRFFAAALLYSSLDTQPVAVCNQLDR